jgi:putative hydrolase of HD superfamily
MIVDRLSKQIQFLIEIDKLKTVFRRSYLENGERFENSAEHSWHITVMAMLLAEYANDTIDQIRVMKMLLIHDIVEIDAGDTYCYDIAAAQDKKKKEMKAADRIFSLLPEDQARELREFWEEFETGTTPEACFANALDRLMPLLHNYYTEGKSWKEHDVILEQVVSRNRKIDDGSRVLWEYAEKIIHDAVTKGYLAAE